MDFFDVTNRYAGLDAKADPLVELAEMVPWEAFRPRLEAIWRDTSVERVWAAAHGHGHAHGHARVRRYPPTGRLETGAGRGYNDPPALPGGPAPRHP